MTTMHRYGYVYRVPDIGATGAGDVFATDALHAARQVAANRPGILAKDVTLDHLQSCPCREGSR